MVRGNKVRDIDLSIRFKHGNQTIFLFVDAMATFGQIQVELLGILEERYPDGILTSTIPPRRTNLPTDASQIKFAVLKNKVDPTEGWDPLDFELDDHPVDKGFEDNMMVAFAMVTDDTDDAHFEVEFPSYEEDELEDAGE
ncbi:hypothetical protein ANO14919_008950 [Xylariales sp. No.14919]|nr:hypothetical protein ANO14919_008950 [Xylariales sp. No.14919]